MSELHHLDKIVFEWINNDLSNSVFDWILPILRDKYIWIPVYFFIVSFCWVNFRQKGYYLLLFLILSTGASDLISSHLIKKSVQRLRPCQNSAVTVVHRVECGSGFSFTSSHASNHFALSIFLFLTLGSRFKKIKPWLIVWASSVAFAQVYVGVHYPLDIIAGGALGSLIAILFYQIYIRSDLAYAWSTG